MAELAALIEPVELPFNGDLRGVTNDEMVRGGWSQVRDIAAQLKNRATKRPVKRELYQQIGLRIIE